MASFIPTIDTAFMCWLDPTTVELLYYIYIYINTTDSLVKSPQLRENSLVTSPHFTQADILAGDRPKLGFFGTRKANMRPILNHATDIRQLCPCILPTPIWIN